MERLGRTTSILICLLFLAAGLFGENGVKTETALDWNEGFLKLSFTIDLQESTGSTLNARHRSEIRIREMLSSSLKKGISPILIDSYFSIGDMLSRETALLLAVEKLAEKTEAERTYLAVNRSSFNGEYLFNLFPDIVSILPLHSVPEKMERKFEWTPTSKFSGLVIYMKGEYPVRGEQKNEHLRPCFFPKLFDSRMNVILKKEMMDPGVITAWGVAAYSDTLDEDQFYDRIGPTPLRIKGVGIFGKNYTDIILSDETADKLLYSEHNKNLLKEGRVLIICDLKSN